MEWGCRLYIIDSICRPWTMCSHVVSTKGPLLAHYSGCPSTIGQLWSLSIWHWLGAQRPQLSLWTHCLSYPHPRSPPRSLVCALLASAGPGHVCGSGSPALMTGGAPHQCIWTVAHGGGALSPLLPLSPQLPLLTARILGTLP